MTRIAEKKQLPERTADIPSDMEIVQRVLNGDPEAFAEILGRYEGHVFAVVRKHLPRDRLEEIAQETFVRAYQSLHNFHRADSFKQWLSAIAVRTCYDYWRKRYRRKEIPMSRLSEKQLEWFDQAVSLESAADIEALGRRREARELLDHALARLSAEDRMVVELIHLEGLSIKEAADLLGWSVTNTKVRAFRSRKKLHKIFTRIRRD